MFQQYCFVNCGFSYSSHFFLHLDKHAYLVSCLQWRWEHDCTISCETRHRLMKNKKVAGVYRNRNILLCEKWQRLHLASKSAKNAIVFHLWQLLARGGAGRCFLLKSQLASICSSPVSFQKTLFLFSDISIVTELLFCLQCPFLVALFSLLKCANKRL